MKNKMLILFIFLIAVTLFLSVDFSKIEVNGNSENNYNVYYDHFKSEALDETVKVVNGVSNTLSSITNIFSNIWNTILRVTGNNGSLISLQAAQNDNMIITSLINVQKKQQFTAEYFNFEVSGAFEKVVFIGKNNLGGVDLQYANFWQDVIAKYNYINFDIWQQLTLVDYTITIYTANTNFSCTMIKADIFALNDLDLIVIPLIGGINNNDIIKTLSREIVTDFETTILNLNNLYINYWLVNNVNENELGLIGSWVQNT